MGIRTSTRTMFGIGLLGAAAAATYACVGDDPNASDSPTNPDGGSPNGTNDGSLPSVDGSTPPACEGIDLQNNDKNCGVCGTACGTGFACKAGVCDNAVVLLGAGERHTCAVLKRGDLYCWGRNATSQLGIGTSSESAPPTVIERDSTLSTIPPITSFALGDAHSCALRPDGTMLCWGSDQYGQLSHSRIGVDGGPRSEPVPLPAFMKTGILAPTDLRYTELSPGSRATHSCAVGGDGGVFCWGLNNVSQAHPDAGVGTDCGEQGTMRCLSLPAPVPVGNAESVAVGEASSCAVRTNGSVACWGGNRSGQLGNGTRGGICLGGGPACARPVDVTGLPSPAAKVSIGANTVCALLEDKSVWCWGNNNADLLGFAHGTDAGDGCCNIEPGCLGGQFCRPTPIRITGIANAAAVALGTEHACVLADDGTVSCWGANDKGQLGNGLLTPSITPTKVIDLPPVASIAAGAGHTCVQTKDGRAFCWGLNDSGQLGAGTANASKPVQVPLP